MAMRIEEDPQPPVDTSKRSVLLATSFAAPGFYLRPLRDKLRQAGYDAHTVHPPMYLNTVIGIKKEIIKKAEKLRERQGGPIAAIGSSLGGYQALSVAYDNPELINEVYTLGSPCGLELRKKPKEVTVVSFVGTHDRVVPARLSSSPDHDETLIVHTNHIFMPHSTEVFTAITDRLGQRHENQERTPLTVVR